MVLRLATIIVLLGWVSETGAVIYTVNPDGTGDFPTIQAAINATADGDIVELADGVFVGPGNTGIGFLGKEITVRSASGNAEVCIIDGEGTRQGVSMVSGETRQSRLEHLTIRNSSQSAVVLLNASPSIVGCHLLGSNHWGVTVTVGTGPLIEDCVISGNRLDGVSGVLGSQITLVGCTITANGVGGVYTVDTVIAERTTFWGNCGPDITLDFFAGARARATASLTCCVVDTTNVATPFGSIHYVADNVFTNPLFCDPAPCEDAPTDAGDYHVDVTSPCLPPGNPCATLIGALGVNCTGATPTVDTSWGTIKDRYRRSEP